MQYSRVLLIDEDDQEFFLLVIKEIAASVECVTLTNARSALTQLEAHALIADVIFLSTSSNIKTINETMALGAKNFITKSSNFKELKNILHRILE